MLKPILDRILLAYGLGLPYHAGKWRVIESIYHAAGLAGSHRNRDFDCLRSGVRWRLNPASLVQRSLYYLGFYERHETAWVLGEARPGWTMFDVGANFGYYSMRVAQALQDQASIHAFEPDLGMYNRLSDNAGLNSFRSVVPQRIALSNTDGELELVTPGPSNEGVGHLKTKGDRIPAERVQSVKSLRMDTYVEFNRIEKLDFVKIDVEGAECLVLEGAKKTIARFRPRLLVEVNPEALATFGVSGDWLLEQLRSLDYAIHRAGRTGLVPLTTTPPMGEYVNAICIPR